MVNTSPLDQAFTVSRSITPPPPPHTHPSFSLSIDFHFSPFSLARFSVLSLSLPSGGLKSGQKSLRFANSLLNHTQIYTLYPNCSSTNSFRYI
ncbi:hypothetical protein L6452_44564 [Arctium lappa]|uniref:Uncharacterized protein n=1 Tax=Arctium lappa TaxID=4217 RepID=A0ACB8XGG6_ARCLA|nr:hypothetical protein L6452_44564 [Arctium lappa]